MKKGRRSYQKPQIKEVKLISEEAVLTICKAASPNLGSKAGRCQSALLGACDNRVVGS